MAQVYSRIGLERRALNVADAIPPITDKATPARVRQAVYEAALTELRAALRDERELVGVQQKIITADAAAQITK